MSYIYDPHKHSILKCSDKHNKKRPWILRQTPTPCVYLLMLPGLLNWTKSPIFHPLYFIPEMRVRWVAAPAVSQAHDILAWAVKMSGYEMLVTPSDFILQLSTWSLTQVCYYSSEDSELEPDGESYQGTRVQY